ncbi:DNRLRE domain-containing protein [Candidatus Woesearchaeota archaeon]|nr:DNRLRE domain-containing protein [Candidatus Woesearchaeota archaeon]
MKTTTTAKPVLFLLLPIITILISSYSYALLQTDIVYSMDDTYVNSSNSTQNYDNSALIIAGTESEIWFRFDLSDPTGHYVARAVLWAYADDMTGNSNFNMFKAASATWTETDLTWDNKPGSGGQEAQAKIDSAGWWNWTITGSYASAFISGQDYVSYLISGTENLVMEDKENTLGTGNPPYLNLTMMIPEAYALSPPDPTSTYNTTITFTYNTTDTGNISECALVLDGAVNKTNTSAPDNATSTFTVSGISPGSHTWLVRCHDSGRQNYQFDTATMDLTVLAKVDWYNPSSATPLDIGSSLLYAAQPSGTRQVYSNNSNSNVDISCASGDCSKVITNWSARSMAGGQALTAYFNCTTTSAGSYAAEFDLTSDQDGISDTLTVNCSVLAPDLRLNSTNITFSNNAPTEDETVTITAGIYNDGTYPVTDAVVRFYEGDYLLGQQIGTDHMISLDPGASTSVDQEWTAKVGDYDIHVVIDPPLDTNGSIDEGDESNNDAYNSISISMWTVFIGNVTGSLALETSDSQAIIKWNVTDTTGSIIYIVDTDSNPDFNSLVAFSRNTTGAYMADDFTELDSAINTTSYPDSVNLTFTSSGSPLSTQTFNVFGRAIDYVPTVSSTNTSIFITGILWDSSDDSNGNHQFDNTSLEDVVFVTKVNASRQGMYGTYDYEIRVPARLKDFKQPDVQTVTFYTEIK